MTNCRTWAGVAPLLTSDRSASASHGRLSVSHSYDSRLIAAPRAGRSRKVVLTNTPRCRRAHPAATQSRHLSDCRRLPNQGGGVWRIAPGMGRATLRHTHKRCQASGCDVGWVTTSL
jgi:hypothetical protein